MKLTRTEYDALIKKHPHLADKGNRPRTQSEEREGVERQVSHVQSKGSEVEEDGNPKFKVTIIFLISDKRKRDLDNGAGTILDCLVASVRRLRNDYGIASTHEESA